MNRVPLRLCLIVLWAGLALPVHAAFIAFDDGTPDSVVGSFYPGVTFSNAQWTDNQGLAGGSGTLGIVPLVYDDTRHQWLEPHAIVATFGSPMSAVSIVGLEVGMNGLTLKAYDATVGGNVIGTATAYGVTEAGFGEFYPVGVTVPGIWRVEMFQPLDQYNDGIILDNFSFTQAVPAPSALLLLMPGLAGVGALRRRLCR